MVCTLIDHRSDVNMFKTQVEPRTTGEWFHCKVLNIFMSCLRSIRVKPWKIVVDLSFTITLTVMTSISIEVSQKIVHMIKRKQIKSFSWSIFLLNIDLNQSELSKLNWTVKQFIFIQPMALTSISSLNASNGSLSEVITI